MEQSERQMKSVCLNQPLCGSWKQQLGQMFTAVQVNVSFRVKIVHASPQTGAGSMLKAETQAVDEVDYSGLSASLEVS